VIHEVSLTPIRSPQEWDALAVRHGGTFFHRHRFLETMAVGLGLTLDLRIATVDGSPIGAVPLLLKRLGPLTTVNWLPFPYVGPLVPDDARSATLAALSAYERSVRCVRAQHVLMITSADAFDGYQASLDRTFVNPVAGRSNEDLLKAMSSNRRGALRRAERAGIQYRHATQHEVTRILPALFGRPFERQGLPAPYSAECFRLTWDQFADDPEVLFQTAEKDGEAIAVQISLAGADRGLGWVMGRVDDAIASDAFVGMCWHTWRWARDRGCREFDLVGAPNEGIASFKRSLGAQERQYTVLQHQAKAHKAAMHVLRRVHAAPVSAGR
jgi:CelD/BcsL family acetyltransferase involved in cellulose biosynthesis